MACQVGPHVCRERNGTTGKNQKEVRLGIVFVYHGFGRILCKHRKVNDAGTENGQPQIWDVVKRTRRHTLQIGIGDVSTPAFSPDGKLVAAGTYADGTLSLIDVSTGKVLAQIQVSMYGCGSVAFSPDGQYLAVPSNPGLVGRRYQGGGSIQVFRVAN